MHADRPSRPSFAPGPNLRFTVADDPGTVGVAIGVTNAGDETATSVAAVIDLPAGVSFVSGDGEAGEGGLRVAYGALAARATAERTFVLDVSGYRDDILVIDDVQLVSTELGTVLYGPFMTELAALPVIELAVDCPMVADVSEIIRIRATVTNAGRSAAQNVAVDFAARGSMIVLAGPATLDVAPGQSTALPATLEPSTAGVRLTLGTMPAASSVTVTALYRVTVPITTETAGVIVAVFDGPTTRKSFERDLAIDARAVFLPAHNALHRAGASTVIAGSTVHYTAQLINDGAAAARSVRVRLAPDIAIDRLDIDAVPPVHVSESFDAASKLLSSVLIFEEVAPAQTITLTIKAHIRDSASNNEIAGLRLFLAHDDRPETEITAANVKVRSLPRFDPETSLIRVETDERIRAYGSAGAKVVVSNEGDASARGVVVTLTLPDGLKVGDVVGARAISPTAFAFEEVPPHSAREAAFRLTLATPRRGSEDLIIRGMLEADGIPALSIEPGLLRTFAQPVFAESSAVLAGVIDEDLFLVRAFIRNTGDASAAMTTLKIEDMTGGEYAYGTTYVNGKRQYETGKQQPRILGHGIRFDEFEPSTTQAVSFAVVPSDLATPSVRLRFQWGLSDSESIVLDARRVNEPVADDIVPLTVERAPEKRLPNAPIAPPPLAVVQPVATIVAEPDPIATEPPVTTSSGEFVRLELHATSAWAGRAVKLADAVRSPGGRVLAALAAFFPNRITPEQTDEQATELAVNVVSERLKEAIAATVAKRMMSDPAAADSGDSSEPFPVATILGDISVVEEFDRMIDEFGQAPGADAQLLAASIPQLYDPSDAQHQHQPRFAVVLPRRVDAAIASPYSTQDTVDRLASIARFLPDNVPGFPGLEQALRTFTLAVIDLPAKTGDVSLDAALRGISSETHALLDEVQKLTIARGAGREFVTTLARAATSDPIE